MTIPFYKYQGTGNDFIILDNRNGTFDGLKQGDVATLCHRRFGIGADGLMLLNSHPDHDFEMKYYNANGLESTMCGNGGRCLVKFAYDQGIIKTTYTFLAIDGVHEAGIDMDGLVSLKMNDVREIRSQQGYYILDTGSPHYVAFTNRVMEMDVARRGREIRYSPLFEQEGINVNFVEQADDSGRITVRTYERGVEDETLSCGTGVTAAALLSHHNANGFNRVEVQTKGGRLSVEYDKRGDEYTDIWLIGPAEKVYKGEIEI